MSQTQHNYEKYSESWKKLQEPMNDFVRLNTETLKGFQAFKPEDFSKISRPDEIWEKQLQWALANGEKAIDYMQQSLKIVEKTMHAFSETCKTEAKK